jgi:hypothetical protein
MTTMVEGARTDDLALTRVGGQGPAGAELNRQIAAARTAGINHWCGRIGQPLNEAEEDAVVILADSLARARLEEPS